MITTETPTKGFADLGLSARTLTALERAGFTEPSPIQTMLIPAALEGRDCLGNAPTGTGKTAAFLIPLIERLDERVRRPQLVVMAPTRELAHQIGREFERLVHGRRLMAAPIVGGESMGRQIQMIRRGAQVLVATPGRMIDLLGQGLLPLDQVRAVVLDEADQMLDIGFRPDVERLLEAMPSPRQTLLLSATMPAAVRELSQKWLVDPMDVRLIRADQDATIPGIRQSYVMVHHSDKVDLLFELLKRDEPQRAIVFCRTKNGADRLGEQLREGGFRADAMHGDLSQNQRHRVLNAFRLGRLNTLVATDVVGRGIDVPDISHVINYDLPDDPEHYIHRIGRTGRMGKDGVAYTFVIPDQGQMLDQIEKAIARDLEPHQVEGVPCPPRPTGHRRPAPGRGGFRGRFQGRRPAGRSGSSFSSGSRGRKRGMSPQAN